MSLAKACSTCGTPLPDDAPEGAVCEACALASPEFVTQASPADLHIPTGIPPLHGSAAPLGTVGDYVILDKLGQGGMGAVYRARQTSLDRLVALKVLPPHCMDDDESIRRFQREASLAASLNHPNLVRVFASGQADGSHFIAMELVEGENLRQRLKRGALPMEEAVGVCLAVARGLQAGWDRAQLVHRDIKPSNIYLSENGDVKLGDLGIAKSLAENTTGLTQTGAALGTALYMSPEQARGEKQIDFRADIYSLGFTLYECLTGHPGYTGTQPSVLISQHLNAAPPGILKVLPKCPMPVVRLFGKMVKKHRNERHNSYADLIAQMESVLDHLANPSTGTLLAQTAARAADTHAPTLVTTAAPNPKPKTSNSKLAVYGGIAAGVLALGAAAFILWPKDTEPTPAQRLAERRAQRAAAPVTPGAVEAKAVASSDASLLWQPFARRDDLGDWIGADAGLAARSVAVRYRWTVTEDSDHHINLSGSGDYNLRWNRREASLRAWVPESHLELLAHRFETPLPLGERVLVEFARIGGVIVGRVGGVSLGPLQVGQDLPKHWAQLMGGQNIPPEYAILDGAPEQDWPEFARLGAHRPPVQIAQPPGPNPSFEALDANGLPTGWRTQEWAAGQATFSVASGSHAHSGERCFSIRAGGEPVDSAALGVVKVKPATRYRLSTWIKTQGVSGALGAFVAWNPLNQSLDQAAPHRTPALSGDNAWTLVEREFVTLGHGFLVIRCSLGGWGTSTGEAWFDDVTLTEITTAPTPATAATTTPAAGTPYPQPRAWVDGTAFIREERMKKAEVKADGEWLEATRTSYTLLAKEALPADHAVRARFANRVEIHLRKQGANFYDIGIHGPWASIVKVQNNVRSNVGTHIKLPDTFADGTEHELVATAVGDRYGLWLDGKLLVSAADPTFTEGMTQIVMFDSVDGGKPARIKRVEWGELEAKRTAAPPAAAAERWQDAMLDPALSGTKRTAAGIAVPEFALFKNGPRKNGAVRFRAPFSFGLSTVKLIARKEGGEGWRGRSYQGFAEASGKSAAVQMAKDNSFSLLGQENSQRLASPVRQGEMCVVEMRVVGNTITVMLNGEVVSRAQDSTLAEGPMGIAVTAKTPVFIQSVESNWTRRGRPPPPPPRRRTRRS